jgi:hypothetical protein
MWVFNSMDFKVISKNNVVTATNYFKEIINKDFKRQRPQNRPSTERKATKVNQTAAYETVYWLNN